MEIRFSPFRRRAAGLADDEAPREPVPPSLLVRELPTPVRLRQVSVVHPDQSGAYRIKSRLRDAGHHQVETFFLPESFLSVLARGHRPHVVVIGDFTESEVGVSGADLARALRLEHDFKGLLLTASADHATLSDAALGIHGFSSRLDSYLSN